MNYVISQTSGKQFLFKPGYWYDIDFVKGSKIGDFILLSKLLAFQKDNLVQVGQPFLAEGKIPATIIQTVKGKKVTVLKTKPKKKYTRVKGHRQLYTRIKII